MKTQRQALFSKQLPQTQGREGCGSQSFFSLSDLSVFMVFSLLLIFISLGLHKTYSQAYEDYAVTFIYELVNRWHIFFREICICHCNRWMYCSILSQFLKEVFVLCFGLRVFLSVKVRQILHRMSFFLRHTHKKQWVGKKTLRWSFGYDDLSWTNLPCGLRKANQFALGRPQFS